MKGTSKPTRIAKIRDDSLINTLQSFQVLRWRVLLYYAYEYKRKSRA